MDYMESKDLLNIDDFEMDELLMEFAQEEKVKNSVIELSDSENELDELVEEFATTLSDSEDDGKKFNAKVILSSSDDEIDNLLDEFTEDDNVESEPAQEKQLTVVPVKKEFMCDTSYDEDKNSIVIDNNTQNDAIYDSAVENLVSDENSQTSLKSPAFPIDTLTDNSNKEHKKGSQNNPNKLNCSESAQNCFKENKNTYLQSDSIINSENSFLKRQNQQSNVNFEKDNQDSNLKRDISTSDEFLSSDNCNNNSNKNNTYLPVKTLPTTKNLDTLVQSFIEPNHLKKDSSPLSVANVTVLCDENVLKSEKNYSMAKLIEHAIESYMRSDLKTSRISSTNRITEKESINCSGVDTNCLDFQEDSSNMFPIIENVKGSNNLEEEKPQNISNCDPNFQEDSSEMLIETVKRSNNLEEENPENISNCDSMQEKNCLDLAEVMKESSENATIHTNSVFSLTYSPIKSEDAIKSEDNKDSVEYLLNDCTKDLKVVNYDSSEKKVCNSSESGVKSKNSLSLEENNSSLSKSVMTEHNIHKEQSNIPKIAVEIKIHISSDDNTDKIHTNSNKIENSFLTHSENTENTNSKTVSIHLNGLTDKFIVPIANVLDKKEAISLNHNSEIMSNAFEFSELNDKDLKGTPECNTYESPSHESKKRKLDFSVYEIDTKKLKQEACNIDNINKLQVCDITSLILTEVNEIMHSDLDKKITVNEKLREFLSIQNNNSYQKVTHRNVGVNVRLFDQKNKKILKTPENAVSNETKNITEETKNQEIVEMPRNAMSEESKCILEEKEVITLGDDDEVPEESKPMVTLEEKKMLEKTKVVITLDDDEAPEESKPMVTLEEKKLLEKTKVMVPLERKKMSVKTKVAVAVEEKKEPELPKTSSLYSPKNVLNMEHQAMPCMTTKTSSPNSCMIAKTSSSNPSITLKNSPTNPYMSTKISPPNVIKSGNRLIPYLNPGKKRLPYSNSVTNNNSVLKTFPGTSNYLQPQQYQRMQKGSNIRNDPLPQQSENGAVSLNQILQIRPSAKYDTSKPSVVLPFRTLPSYVTPARTMNPTSFTVSRNSVRRNLPSASESLRNQIFHPSTATSDGFNSAIRGTLIKSPTGLMQSNMQYRPSFTQFSQSYTLQGPMVNSFPFPLHQPATSNLQRDSIYHLSNSACDPLTAMNNLSSMCCSSVPLSHSVSSLNPSPSVVTSPAFYPRTANYMNNFVSNQSYPRTTINQLISSSHDSIQHQQLTQATRNNNVTTSAISSVSSSKVTSTIPPPTTSSSEFITVPSTTSASQYVNSKKNSLAQANRNNNVTTSANPSVPSSKLTSTIPPPSASSSKLTTIPSTISTSQSANFKKKIPPFPEAPSYSDSLPKPILKVSKEGTDVILSWNVNFTSISTNVLSYQIYSCHISNEIEVHPVWKKVGDVAALRLPMACRLRQFEKNNSYHFIIRIKNTLQQYGPFSNPASVNI